MLMQVWMQHYWLIWIRVSCVNFTFWPRFLEIWRRLGQNRSLLCRNRHEVKQSRDTRPLPREEKYGSVWCPLGLKDFLPLVIWRISDQYNLLDFLLNGVAHFVRINIKMYLNTCLKLTNCPSNFFRPTQINADPDPQFWSDLTVIKKSHMGQLGNESAAASMV